MTETTGYMHDVPFPGITEVKAKIDRLLRGENIAQAAVDAAVIPSYYGTQETAGVCDAWLRMWQRMAPIAPQDEGFYLSNAIGWASR